MALGTMVPAAAADPLELHAGAVTYVVDPASLRIDAKTADGTLLNVMPPLHAPGDAAVAADGDGWQWSDGESHRFRLSAAGDALELTISAPAGTSLSWNMPAVAAGTWLVPDGEGMAYDVDDPFWRQDVRHERCLGGASSLSFPAWSYLTQKRAVTYVLGDGLASRLCLYDDNGVEARLTHDFKNGADTVDLLFAVGPPELLAPAHFYRRFLMARGAFKSFADKAVPDLPRLFGASQAYVWGTGHKIAFLDDLKRLGIARMVLTYSADMKTTEAQLRAFFEKAHALGYLAGPYELFVNAQPAKTSDDPTSVWPRGLYPWGCIRKADGAVLAGFGAHGCKMSSAALVLRKPFEPAMRYAKSVASGAGEVFVDSDAFGEFFDDTSPDHAMTKAQDRDNRLARLALAMTQFHLVVGSEKVVAWSAPAVHFSHGTLEVHQATIWPMLGNAKMGGWWPGDRPPLFFKPYTPTAYEARVLFGAADRLPLFEAAFHDSVVTSDRWEFDLMKFVGEERYRFALSLLYGTPTMWNLDRRELARVGVWLMAAAEDFRAVHGIDTPVALTDFAWLTADRLVQQARYADGRTVVANFGAAPWHDLGPDCVRVTWPRRSQADLCPPTGPAP